MKKFVIETVKWNWPEPVKNKEIYRDEEFVRTKTKEEALEAIDFLLNSPKGLTYTITVFRDGEYFTYYRHSMPCLGGLAKYADSHGKEKHFMNPYFPRDIYVAFPEGEIVFIGCYRANSKKVLENPYWEFVFSQESPWVTAFNKKESIIFADNYFVLTDMDTDPTVFYSLMRLGGFANSGMGLGGVARKDWSPKAEVLIRTINGGDPRRLAGQKPIKISGGTWAQGFGYTRPYNESIFKTSLPHKLKDFGSLAGYPQAPFTPSYLMSEMKGKFGIDNVHKGDKCVHDALVKSWDHFKEEAKKLEE